MSERQVPLAEHIASGKCSLSRCPNPAKNLVTWTDSGVSERYCGNHSWPFEKGLSMQCEITPLEPVPA